MDIVYKLLSPLYGDELHDFLLGVNGDNSANLFNVMFIVLALFSIGVIPWFYYKLWDRSSWNTFGKWLMMLIVNAVVVFVINIVWVYCLKGDMIDDEGERLSIGLTNFVGFGFASAILASLLFFLASLGWKTKSLSCPDQPF